MVRNQIIAAQRHRRNNIDDFIILMLNVNYSFESTQSADEEGPCRIWQYIANVKENPGKEVDFRL